VTWTVSGSRPHCPRPGRRSDAFPAYVRTIRALGWTVYDGAGESSLVGFGGLDDNSIKGLTGMLSVE
jgi:hypothetical protein